MTMEETRMTKYEKIQEICQNCIQSLGYPLSNAIADAIVEGYKLGWLESLKCLWKDAQGDDLPPIDKEVVVLDKNGKVSFGHRPVESYTGVSLTNHSEMEEFFPERYDKGGWNIPDIVWWLDLELPKIEL